MKLLDDYLALQEEIFKHFGYVEDWRVIPIDDARKYYWDLSGEGSGDTVRFSEDKALLEDEEAGEFYSNEVYTQRFLKKWVYRADDYTMICVDTHVDGNQFLQIFDNKKEV